MDVVVRAPTGERVLTPALDATVGSITREAARAFGFPLNSVQLCFGDDMLDGSDALLADTGVTSGAVLELKLVELTMKEVEMLCCIWGEFGGALFAGTMPQHAPIVDWELAAGVLDISPGAFEHLHPLLRDDKETALQAASRDSRMLEFASERLRDDPEVVKAAMEGGPWALLYASDRLRNDTSFVRGLVDGQPTFGLETLSTLPVHMRGDREIVLRLLNRPAAHCNTPRGEIEYDEDIIDEELRDDFDVMVLVVQADPYFLPIASERLRNSTSFVQRAFDFSGTVPSEVLTSLGDDVLKDPEVVALTIQLTDGLEWFPLTMLLHSNVLEAAVTHLYEEIAGALPEAPQEVRESREVAKALVYVTPSLLEYVGEGLRRDKEFVLELVADRVCDMRHVHERLLRDKEVVLGALKGMAQCDQVKCIDWVPHDMLQDHEVLEASALVDFAYVLREASDILRDDPALLCRALRAVNPPLHPLLLQQYGLLHRDVVLETLPRGLPVRAVPDALLHDSEVIEKCLVSDTFGTLRRAPHVVKDKHLMALAVLHCPFALTFADCTLRGDKSFILHILEHAEGPLDMSFVHPDLLHDRDVVLAGLVHAVPPLAWLPATMLHDRDVLLAALRTDAAKFREAPPESREDSDVACVAVWEDPDLFGEVAHSLRNDTAFVLRVLERFSGAGRPFPGVWHIGDNALRHTEVVLGALRVADGADLRWIPHTAWHMHEVVHDILEAFPGSFLAHAPPEVFDDEDTVRMAVASIPTAFRHASERLRGCKDFVVDLLNSCINECRRFRDLSYIACNLLRDREVVQVAMQTCGSDASWVPDTAIADPTLLLPLLKNYGSEVSERIPDEQCDDQEMMHEVVAAFPAAFSRASERLRGDTCFVRNFLDMLDRTGRSCDLRNVSPGVWDRELVLKGLAVCGRHIDWVPDALLADEEVALRCIEKNHTATAARLPPEMADNAHVVTEMLSLDLSLFRYVGSTLRSTKEFVLLVMERFRPSDPNSFFPHLPADLLQDPDIIIRGVTCSRSVAWVPPAGMLDESAMVACMRTDMDTTFSRAPERIRDSKVVMKEALYFSPTALEHASLRLRSDREVLKELLEHFEGHRAIENGIMRWMATTALGDPQLLKKALAIDPRYAIHQAPLEMRDDLDIMLEAVKREPDLFPLSGEGLLGSRGSVLALLEAIHDSPSRFDEVTDLLCLSNSLLYDPDVVILGVKTVSTFSWVPKKMLYNPMVVMTCMAHCSPLAVVKRTPYTMRHLFCGASTNI
eukprot:Sspe_Gene.99716::Locus_73490_Transcript_1_1_Confidence_1.000_Length_4022::g.99716::m.99716